MLEHLYRTAALMGLALAASPAVAMPLSEVRKFDIDGDGFIEKGAESRALQSAFSQLKGRQQARFVAFAESDEEKIAVSAFDFASLEEELEAACSTPKRFYFAESLGDVSLVHPDIVKLSDKGARFSLSRDFANNNSTWAMKGAAVFAPMANRCLHVESPDPLPRGALTGYAFAPYLSFEGQGSSAAPGTSDLRIGIMADLQFLGGNFDLQQLQFSAYFGTDFQGEAEVYGLGMSWTPYHFTSRLNGLRGDSDNSGVFYVLSADIEYKDVIKAGNTGLTSGTQYGWIGINAGVGYALPKLSGVLIDASVDGAYDAINDQDAVKFSAGMTIPVGENAAFDLRYTNGFSRNAPTFKQDGLAANLRIRF